MILRPLARTIGRRQYPLNLLHRPLCPSSSFYATAAALKGKAKVSDDKTLHIIDELENEGARVLRVVRGRMAERARLLKEMETDSATGSSSTAHIQRAKLLKELEPLARSWEEWTRILEDVRETSTLLTDSDPDIRNMALEEHATLSDNLRNRLSTFPSLILPESSTAHFSALMEIKAGAGGDESTLFLSEMLRMYTRLAQNNAFAVDVVSFSASDPAAGSGGGGKEAILEIKGTGAYDKFRFESGVHRVQRVPATEAKGRLHTSTVAVVVLPTSDDKAPESDLDVVDPKDVRTDVMRSQGAGGQHVNRTESAVRLTHEPTGITVTMQDSRSQHSNRAKAWQILRARLLDRKMLQEQQERRDSRRDLVKSADRSEKIRTYNFPQDRLTDHRINYSVNNLDGVMEGDEDSGLEDIIAELKQNHSMAQLEEMLEKADQDDS